MGVVAWLRGEAVTSGKRDGYAASTLGGGVVPVDPGTHRSLLSLAGYSPAQLPTQITRADCLKVPALSQGMATLLSIGSMLPLVADPSDQADSFLAELDPDYAPGYTVARTLDDLIVYGLSWWKITSRTSTGFPRTCRRYDPTRVMVDSTEGALYLDGEKVPAAQLQDWKRFDGLLEGLLTRGAEAITTALANVRQTRVYATNPKPSMVLTDEDGAEPLEPDEARNYITAYSQTMREHGIGYLAGFKINDYGWNATDIQLVPARQMDAVEMARLLAMPSDYVNAPAQGSSLHYANIAEVRRDLIDVGGLAQYLGPIEQRLSMPDMTPRGTTVKFDADSVFLRITPDQPAPTPEGAAV